MTHAELEIILGRTLTPTEKEMTDVLSSAIDSIYKLASRIFPKGDSQTELEKMTRACIPDTWEWFEAKFATIAELDTAIEMLTCLKEWQKYVVEQSEEYIARRKEIIRIQELVDFQKRIIDELPN